MEQCTSNLPKLAGREIVLEPNLFGLEGEFRDFCRGLENRLNAAGDLGRQAAVKQAREEIAGWAPGPANKPKLALQFACSVVVDVVAQGWNLKRVHKVVKMVTPVRNGETPSEIKRRIRAGHLLERDAQLQKASVSEFIQSMEKRRLGPTGWISIYSLMRDGRDLSRKLAEIAKEQDEAKRYKQLRTVVSPYLQLVDGESTCALTGLKLIDIWRYFRHTWVSTYKSLPGRSMMVLVRDAAVPNHPVIGIGALGSSMSQQTFRDRWIGWDSDDFVKKLGEQPSVKWCRWILDSISRLMMGLYKKDLVADKLIKLNDLRWPTADIVKRLQVESIRCAKLHQQFPDAAEHKSGINGDGSGRVDWEKQAKTMLFRSKRTKTLSVLLDIRRNLQETGLERGSAESLRLALGQTKGKHAIRQLVRLVKQEHVGVDMMDIIICGAVAPYNALLGGKLVCMLLSSPEVVQFYGKRYGDKASIIASSSKGKPVFRPPNLVLLATTSLYGVGSSQYNRIHVPLAELGLKATPRGFRPEPVLLPAADLKREPELTLSYTELGMSRGFGSYHFSNASLEYLNNFIPRGGEIRKVNSIFGEGVNPLMRKLRDGLAVVKLPAEDLLRHGNARVVYGVPLAHNFREVLLGLDARPKYFLSLRKADVQTRALGNYWTKRWLCGRITRPGILDEVARHTLAYPVAHGARVLLPKEPDADLLRIQE